MKKTNVDWDFIDDEWICIVDGDIAFPVGKEEMAQEARKLGGFEQAQSRYEELYLGTPQATR